MNCNICDSKTEYIFKAKILLKYDVDYYKCSHCGFIQQTEPFWLEEAYTSAITSLDIGLVKRNIGQSKKVAPIISRSFDESARFLDYGGGYGLFVRLMRDMGLDFYRYDSYCENLFANEFDLDNIDESARKFELITAFEVFEHLPKPIAEINKMTEYGENILFSTQLQPEIPLTDVNDWWYFTPETGQHVALYTKYSLQVLAESLNQHLYTDGNSMHLLSTKPFKKNPINESLFDKIQRRFNLKRNIKSLQKRDLQLIKNKLQKNAISQQS